VNPQSSEHTLHLHSPKIDKYTIQMPYLFLCDGEEEAIYVTSNPSNRLPSDLGKRDFNFEVVDFNRFFRLENGLEQLRIVVDASSMCREARFHADAFDFVLKLEGFINRLCEKRPTKCLCTYDVALLDPQMIKQLTQHHGKLLLTTSDVTVLSGDSIDRSELPKDSFEEIVKNNLETIVLALLQRRPMCGIEIMQEIHRDFNVFLSPGAVYPLLHTLDERGLLRFEVLGKAKRYFPAGEEAEEEIQSILKERIQVSTFLSGYLRHTITSDHGKGRDFLVRQCENLRTMQIGKTMANERD
jgi:DNA-binding PadR family transcriptional regulator